MRCPYCQLDNKKASHHYAYKDVHVIFYECKNCGEFYAGTREGKFQKALNPDHLDLTNFPDLVRELSPEAFRIYCNCLTLREIKLFEFAGIGLRKALENLLWDYLRIVKKITKPQKSLNEMILVMPIETNPFYAKVCNEIIRLYGNDSAHRCRKFPDISIDDAFQSFETLCDVIAVELRIIAANKKLPNDCQAKP